MIQYIPIHELVPGNSNYHVACPHHPPHASNPTQNYLAFLREAFHHHHLHRPQRVPWWAGRWFVVSVCISFPCRLCCVRRRGRGDSWLVVFRFHSGLRTVPNNQAFSHRSRSSCTYFRSRMTVFLPSLWPGVRHGNKRGLMRESLIDFFVIFPTKSNDPLSETCIVPTKLERSFLPTLKITTTKGIT